MCAEAIFYLLNRYRKSLLHHDGGAFAPVFALALVVMVALAGC